ncbi:carbohydrate ABC transporter permease [Curtobacterium sp. MCBA15_012]|uniref:carbohydrate ABC transporter permease n=1 Tax=Curtobacterium sp. MCBA15_012 TaxID=1898738 RepID=UPI0008DDE088|nr:sugar ABC transporter permease [Curtobacterium sp. MCBA15_012]WIB00908.1 sugar ABC transporter permease [Curtobacterium sp. MCBA15_012]
MTQVQTRAPRDAERPPREVRPHGRTPLYRRERPLWMLLPGGVLMLVVIVVPLLVGVYIAMLDLDQYTLRQWFSAPFVGLANFVEAFTDSPLLHSVWISVSLSVLVTAATVPIGVAAAISTQNRFPGRGLVRSVYLIPYVLPAFVVGTFFRTMLQPQGVVNTVFGTDVLWLNGSASYWALAGVMVWTSWPFVYLLSLAGLQAVDGEVHEAAALDGVTWWAKLRYIVFPYLRGPLSLAVIISILHNINNFTLPFVLFGIPLPSSVEVMPVLTYIASFQSFRFGLSAAMAICSLVIVAIPLFVYLRAVKLDTGDDAGPTRKQRRADLATLAAPAAADIEGARA